MLNYINGDLVGRTNLTNFRASECRTEFIRAMLSAVENIKKDCRVQPKISNTIL